MVRNPPANAGGGGKRCRFDPWVRKMPWMRKWHLTPVFLPGKPHAQRILVGSWGHKESNTAEHMSTGTAFIKKKKKKKVTSLRYSDTRQDSQKFFAVFTSTQ